ncbi:response regulator receiver protein [Mucilaginibacter agri]|uniref:Response regulator receiver protein n=1 Tax=Mucilaginibacter agri TaxID=2695265 RepID=A0A966DU15_9SPHI|nr:response regulator receiver protein [Mucilaginibacter agri]NCD69971.1 response regulator receiver protein [Mucilaginibacter agri]
MKKIEIFAVCGHDGILQTIQRLINNNEQWNATCAANAAQVAALLAQSNYNLLLIGSALSEGEEAELEQMAANKNIPVIKHYGGGSGLLFGEIHEALRNG